MTSRRAVQLGNTVRSELSELISRRVKDARLEGFITITGVEMTDDLKQAKVFFCLMGEEATAGRLRDVLAGLRSSAGFLKGELGRRLRMRHPPELTFAHDESFDYAGRIERILKDLHEHDEGDPEGGGDT